MKGASVIPEGSVYTGMLLRPAGLYQYNISPPPTPGGIRVGSLILLHLLTFHISTALFQWLLVIRSPANQDHLELHLTRTEQKQAMSIFFGYVTSFGLTVGM